MAEQIQVMLVDENRERSALLQGSLARAGYRIVARVHPEEDLFECVRRHRPDVIIIDMESPSRDTLEHMRSINRESPRPIVMFSDNDDREAIRAAVGAGVSAYIVDGLHSHRVRPILEVAIARFQEFQGLRRELEDARTSLAERKAIDRAKGILMDQRGMNERQAYAALRKMAMDKNLRIGQVAEQVIAVTELLG